MDSRCWPRECRSRIVSPLLVSASPGRFSEPVQLRQSRQDRCLDDEVPVVSFVDSEIGRGLAAFATVEAVRRAIAAQDIDSVAAEDDVDSAATEQGIVAVSAADDVIAIAGIHYVSGLATACDSEFAWGRLSTHDERLTGAANCVGRKPYGVSTVDYFMRVVVQC